MQDGEMLFYCGTTDIQNQNVNFQTYQWNYNSSFDSSNYTFGYCPSGTITQIGSTMTMTDSISTITNTPIVKSSSGSSSSSSGGFSGGLSGGAIGGIVAAAVVVTAAAGFGFYYVRRKPKQVETQANEN